MALGRGGLPHDLIQMIVEGSVGIERGFWGSVAAGATFKSTGRKRTKPGRAVIVSNRDAVAQAEQIVALLKGSSGASLRAIMDLTGWQSHSVRGFISAQLGKRMGFRIQSFKRDGERIYRIRS